jgi:hypothetical protein
MAEVHRAAVVESQHRAAMAAAAVEQKEASSMMLARSAAGDGPFAAFQRDFKWVFVSAGKINKE